MFTDFPNILQDGEPVAGVDVVDGAVIGLPYAWCFRVRLLVACALVRPTFVARICSGCETGPLGRGVGDMAMGSIAVLSSVSLLDNKVLRRKGRY